MKRYYFFVLICLLVLSFPVLAGYQAPDYSVMDIGPELRAWEPTQERIFGGAPVGILSEGNSGGEGGASTTSSVGEYKYWFGLDAYCGYYYFKLYQLRAIGDNCEVWVAVDLSWTIPPGERICKDKPSDPRSTPVITDENVQYILEEFENTILPLCTDFFGEPDYHNGGNSLLVAWGEVPPGYYDGERYVCLVDNVRDDNYYYDNYPIYIAGVYAPAYDFYFDRNIITIDAYDWDNRTGPDAEHPNLYESIVAHEFQHLQHQDKDPDEELWVNEGCSTFAMYLCYCHPMRYVEQFLELAENSLVAWEDQGNLEVLSDYGFAYLWTENLYEHFGGEFIRAMVANPDNGIAGINSTLDAFLEEERFADIYHKFVVSLITDPGYNGGGAYAFNNIDVQVELNEEAYDTPGAPPWGTDFIRIDDPQEVISIAFNGDDYTIFSTPWSSDESVLWSGTGSLIDNWLIVPVDLTGETGSATLEMIHKYSTEPYWDFCFVQVSTDGGHTWTSLEDNEGLMKTFTEPGAHPKITANVPGFTGSSPDFENSFVTSTFDLSPYLGQNIYLSFRYVTDWNTELAGWFIDVISVDSDEGNVFYSDCASVEGFLDITEINPIDNDFTVTLVGVRETADRPRFKVLPLPTNSSTEYGIRANLSAIFSDSDFVVALVTFDAPQGVTSYADYTLEIVRNGL